MTLADVYCRYNRARGLDVSGPGQREQWPCLLSCCLHGNRPFCCHNLVFLCACSQLVSPDDLYTACCMFERLKLPIR